MTLLSWVQSEHFFVGLAVVAIAAGAGFMALGGVRPARPAGGAGGLGGFGLFSAVRGGLAVGVAGREGRTEDAPRLPNFSRAAVGSGGCGRRGRSTNRVKPGRRGKR